MTTQKSANPSDSHERERRRYRRFLAGPLELQVHYGSRTVRGKLINESIGGLALTTHDVGSFHVGQQVSANMRDTLTTGYVRSVHRNSDGTYRVGISWDKGTTREANATADYLAHEDFMLVCVLLCDKTGPLRQIRLWDGAEFEVPAEDVHSRSYDQRRDELNEAPTKLPTLAQLYGLNPIADTSEIVLDILNFEFSSQYDTHDGRN